MNDTVYQNKGILYEPHTISIHITDICNRKCKFCSEASHEHAHDLIRKEDILKFLKSQDTGVWSALNIHGGEPTLSPYLIEVVQNAHELGYRYIILQTNGHRIGSDYEYAKKLIDADISLYNIGFHGSNSKIMDELTGTGSFEKTMNGIRTIAGFNKAIRITVVVCSQNYKDLPSIVSLAVKEGISHINISAMQTGGSALRSLDYLLVSYSQAGPYIAEAVCMAEQLKLKVTLEGFPFCILPGLERYQVDWTVQRLKVFYRKMVIDDYNKFLTDTIRTFGEPCTCCKKRKICTGVYKEYVNKYGWNEFNTYM